MKIENVSLQLCKQLTKARISYKIAQLLACNYKILKRDLVALWNRIEESCIPTN